MEVALADPSAMNRAMREALGKRRSVAQRILHELARMNIEDEIKRAGEIVLRPEK